MLQLVRTALRKAILDHITVTEADDYTPVLGAAYLGLYQTKTGNPPDMVLGDLVEADYTGYARQLLVWGTPYDGSDGRPSVLSGMLTFRPTDAVTPNTINGAFLATAATAGALVAVDPFSGPRSMSSALDVLNLAVEHTLDNNINAGKVLLVD